MLDNFANAAEICQSSTAQPSTWMAWGRQQILNLELCQESHTCQQRVYQPRRRRLFAGILDINEAIYNWWSNDWECHIFRRNDENLFFLICLFILWESNLDHFWFVDYIGIFTFVYIFYTFWDSHLFTICRFWRCLQLMAHSVNLLNVSKYHFRVNSLVLDHAIHVIGCQEVGDTAKTFSIGLLAFCKPPGHMRRRPLGRAFHCWSSLPCHPRKWSRGFQRSVLQFGRQAHNFVFYCPLSTWCSQMPEERNGGLVHRKPGHSPSIW